MKLTARSRWILLFCALSWAGPPASGEESQEPASSEACHEEGKDILCGHAQATLARLLAEDNINITLADTASPLDVIHCFLDIELSFSTRTLAGSNTLTLESRTPGLASVSLDLRDNMTVDGVTLGGKNLAFARGNHKLAITLDRAYNVGEQFAVKVAYRGAPQSLGWKSFTFTSSLAASLSQPWYAHTWWPCKDELDDKFTMDFWITVPSNRTAVANGSLQGVDVLSGSRNRYRWKESYPIATYLVSVAAADYGHWNRTYVHPAGAMPIDLYAYSLSDSSAQAVMDHLLTAVTTFSRPEIYGEYPFVNEKYGIAEYSGSVNMEHQTISSHWTFDLHVINHELAHQWWGDNVTCRTWHDIWLNEGFATYSEAVFEEKKPGGSFAAYQARMTTRRPTDYSGSVYVYDISTQTGIFSSNLVYRKAAWVLHMLRHVMGDADFFATLAAYRAAYQGRSATTDDFRRIAESVHGASLEWFFNEWVYGYGGPTYSCGWQDIEEGGTRELRLMLRQTQTGYPLFRMPIDVTVTTATGSTTYAVWHEYADHWYRLPVDGPVTAVTIDKDAWILRPSVSVEPYLVPPSFRLLWAWPSPGTSGPAAMRVSQLHLEFEQPPVYDASDFSVTGSVSGMRAFSVSNAGDSNVVRLGFNPPLQANQLWTVHVSDRVRAAATGQSLDGELQAGAGALPSGDGLPGGDAIFSFFAQFPGDFDGDADVDLEDFGRLQRCLGESGVVPVTFGCLDADLDHDNDVDPVDLVIFSSCMHGPGAAPAIVCGT